MLLLIFFIKSIQHLAQKKTEIKFLIFKDKKFFHYCFLYLFKHKKLNTTNRVLKIFIQNTEFLGLLAGIVSTISFLPQVIKVWKTGETQGLSLGMYITYLIGLILWGVYAWLIGSTSLLITEIVTSLLVIYILAIIIKQMIYKGFSTLN